MINLEKIDTATKRAAHVIATETEAVRDAQAAYYKAWNKKEIAYIAMRRDETTEESYSILSDISAAKMKEYERVYNIAYEAALNAYLKAYKEAEEKFTKKA
jgi:hypothetical protein